MLPIGYLLLCCFFSKSVFAGTPRSAPMLGLCQEKLKTTQSSDRSPFLKDFFERASQDEELHANEAECLQKDKTCQGLGIPEVKPEKEAVVVHDKDGGPSYWISKLQTGLESFKKKDLCAFFDYAEKATPEVRAGMIKDLSKPFLLGTTMCLTYLKALALRGEERYRKELKDIITYYNEKDKDTFNLSAFFDLQKKVDEGFSHQTDLPPSAQSSEQDKDEEESNEEFSDQTDLPPSAQSSDKDENQALSDFFAYAKKATPDVRARMIQTLLENAKKNGLSFLGTTMCLTYLKALALPGKERYLKYLKGIITGDIVTTRITRYFSTSHVRKNKDGFNLSSCFSLQQGISYQFLRQTDLSQSSDKDENQATSQRSSKKQTSQNLFTKHFVGFFAPIGRFVKDLSRSFGDILRFLV